MLNKQNELQQSPYWLLRKSSRTASNVNEINFLPNRIYNAIRKLTVMSLIINNISYF